jgi:mitochondrial enoyl-[acyl-carrier protein] reductase / trans-2-enoyl-CoA reductase
MRLCFHQTGNPLEVLQLEPWDPPAPEQHEVVVRMLYAPVHPADLNFIEGSYGRAPVFPAVPGHEGCGRVEAVGRAAGSLAVGDLVIPLQPDGFWSERIIAPEHHFAKLPDGLDLQQASMLRVNPCTAWRMLHDFRELAPGAWIVQNAANSAVGRAVIQIAKHLGWHTLNFVRRVEVADELLAMGADAVFTDDDAGLARAKELTKEIPLTLALNAVGGDSALRLMDLLSPHGALVTYGAMSRRSMKMPNKFLIFKDLEIRGYWITRWMERAASSEIASMLRALAELMKEGILRMPVDTVYDLSSWRDAIALAQTGGRSGKVLLRLSKEA